MAWFPPGKGREMYEPPRAYSTCIFLLEVLSNHQARSQRDAGGSILTLSETIADSSCPAQHAAGYIKHAVSEPTGSLLPQDTG